MDLRVMLFCLTSGNAYSRGRTARGLFLAAMPIVALLGACKRPGDFAMEASSARRSCDPDPGPAAGVVVDPAVDAATRLISALPPAADLAGTETAEATADARNPHGETSRARVVPTCW